MLPDGLSAKWLTDLSTAASTLREPRPEMPRLEVDVEDGKATL